MSKQTIALYLLGVCFFNQTISSQVTIGSVKKPLHGALLDLKQTDSRADKITSTKGLALPRVNLTSKTDLFPMFDKDSEDYMDNQKVEEDRAHVGLLVFHINVQEDPSFQSGLYLWDGEKWDSLTSTTSSSEGPKEKPEDSEIGSVTGRSGTVYKTRKFGKAGEWMVENLRETSYDVGEPNPQVINEKINKSHMFGEANYYYPNMDKALFQQHPEYGLLYSYVAATNGRVTERGYFSEGQGTSGRVQGICPTGWVVPSLHDWRNLRKELSENPEKYSVNKDGTKIGYTSKSSLKVKDSPHDISGASIEYGFNALMVGVISEGAVSNYGWKSAFWSSSIYSEYLGFSRELISNYDYTLDERNNNWMYDMYSIRCMKRQYIE